MTIIKPILFYSLFLLLMLAFTSKGEEPKGLSVGDDAPKFKAIDQFNNSFDLEDQLKKGPVVLMFYRGHWCKYCNRQLEELSDSLGFIIEKGASVVTVTPEIMEFVDETSKKYNNSFRIISDVDMKIMNAYKVRFEVDKGTNSKYKIWGIKLDEFNGDNGTNLPVPATYIINQDGTIKYAFFNKNYKKRVSIKTILRNL
ncbi:MAG: AhpC/TSA family protein [Cyclobacteriaceae bacterium]|nr:AhpC/TSA family protein [Cyclobacteriaceae bacterium]